MARTAPAAGPLGVAVGRREVGGQSVRDRIPCLPRLSGLEEREGADARPPRQVETAEHLGEMRPVAAQRPVLVVPHLPAVAVGEVGRTDEQVGVVVPARVVLIEVPGVAAPHVRGVQVAALAPPHEFERGLRVLRTGVVELGDHVTRSADLGPNGIEARHVEAAGGDVGGSAVVAPGSVPGVLPEVPALPAAQVDAERQSPRQRPGRAERPLVDAAGLHAVLEHLAGRSRIRLVGDDPAALVEQHAEAGAGVPVPGGGARQRGRLRVVAGVVREHRALRPPGPGDAEARLDHVPPVDRVHPVLLARRQGEAGHRALRRPQPLSVQDVPAQQHAGIDGEVARGQPVMDFQGRGLREGVDRRDHRAVRAPQAHLLHPGDVEDRRSVRRQVDAAGRLDGAPTVRFAAQRLARLGGTQPEVEVVAHGAPAELAVERQFEAPPVERLVVDRRMRADGPAPAARAPLVRVAVALHEGPDRRVVGIGAVHVHRHAEVPHPVQVLHVQRAVERRPDGQRQVGPGRALEFVVAEPEREGARSRLPHAVDVRHPLVRPAAERYRIGFVGPDRDAVLLAPGGTEAGVEQHPVRRRVRQPAVELAARVLVVLDRSVGRGRVRPLLRGPEGGSEEEEPRRTDRAAEGGDGPLAVRVVSGHGFQDRLGFRLEIRRLHRVLDAARKRARTRPCRRVHRESAAAVEAHRRGAGALERHLVDVVARKLGRQRAEHRQRHVDAVEAVHVVLAAAAGGRSADAVLGDLDARREPDEAAVVGTERHVPHRLAVDGAGHGGAAADGDPLADHDELLADGGGRGVEFQVQGRRLAEQHLRLDRAARSRRGRERDPVEARREPRQRVAAGRVRGGRPGPGHGAGLGQDADALGRGGVAQRHRPFDAPGLLGRRGAGAEQQRQGQERDANSGRLSAAGAAARPVPDSPHGRRPARANSRTSPDGRSAAGQSSLSVPARRARDSTPR